MREVPETAQRGEMGPDNTGVRGLYRELGYVETQLSEVIDEWGERDESGRGVRAHAGACLYPMKSLPG
jgi:hypothetical protein